MNTDKTPTDAELDRAEEIYTTVTAKSGTYRHRAALAAVIQAFGAAPAPSGRAEGGPIVALAKTVANAFGEWNQSEDQVLDGDTLNALHDLYDAFHNPSNGAPISTHPQPEGRAETDPEPWLPSVQDELERSLKHERERGAEYRFWAGRANGIAFAMARIPYENRPTQAQPDKAPSACAHPVAHQFDYSGDRVCDDCHKIFTPGKSGQGEAPIPTAPAKFAHKESCSIGHYGLACDCGTTPTAQGAGISREDLHDALRKVIPGIGGRNAAIDRILTPPHPHL